VCVLACVCMHVCVCIHVCILDCNFTVQVSPLLLATHQGHLKVVKLLLEYPRIDVTLTNEAGHNALAEAIINGHK